VTRFIIKRNKRNPFFSIITVVKNDEKNISRTIKSIISQKFKNFEYIIIDGRSEDETIREIKKYKKKINLLSSDKDDGIYYAMNRGVNISKGKVLVFVNSGDKLNKNALKYVEKIFSSKKDIDFVFGTVKRHYTKKTILKHGFNIKRLVYNFDFATSHSVGFYLKKKAFMEIGKFNTSYKCSADYDLYYRLILNHKKKGESTKKNEVVGEVAAGGYSSSVPFINHLLEETRIRVNNKQNFIIVFLIFLNAIIKNIFK